MMNTEQPLKLSVFLSVILLLSPSTALAAQATDYGEGAYGSGYYGGAEDLGGESGGFNLIPKYETVVLDEGMASFEITVDFNPLYSYIDAITLLLNENIEDVSITARRLTEKVPSGYDAPSDEIYQFVEITAPSLDGKIEKATIDFVVYKTWPADALNEGETIVLYRYHDGYWETLVTEEIDSGLLTKTYRAESSGFSLFAIGVEKREQTSVPVAPPEGGQQPGVTEPVPSFQETPASESEEEQTNVALLGLFGMAAIFGAGAAIVHFIRRLKRAEPVQAIEMPKKLLPVAVQPIEQAVAQPLALEELKMPVQETFALSTTQEVTLHDLSPTSFELRCDRAKTSIERLYLKPTTALQKVTVTIDKIVPEANTEELKTYRYLKIRFRDVEKNAIKPESITFVIETSWLDRNHLTKEQVSLYGYSNGELVKLKTQHQFTHKGLEYYAAETGGATTLAIVGTVQVPEETMTPLHRKIHETKQLIAATKEQLTKEQQS